MAPLLRGPRRATDEVRTYRIADTGDVVEPEARAGEPNADDDSSIIDSEVEQSVILYTAGTVTSAKLQEVRAAIRRLFS